MKKMMIIAFVAGLLGQAMVVSAATPAATTAADVVMHFGYVCYKSPLSDPKAAAKALTAFNFTKFKVSVNSNIKINRAPVYCYRVVGYSDAAGAVNVVSGKIKEANASNMLNNMNVVAPAPTTLSTAPVVIAEGKVICGTAAGQPAQVLANSTSSPAFTMNNNKSCAIYYARPADVTSDTGRLGDAAQDDLTLGLNEF